MKDSFGIRHKIMALTTESANGRRQLFNKKSAKSSQIGAAPCVFCARVRVFLLIVCILLALIAFRIELSFLQNVSLTAIAADLIAIAVIGTLLWKGYHEYWKSDERDDD